MDKYQQQQQLYGYQSHSPYLGSASRTQQSSVSSMSSASPLSSIGLNPALKKIGTGNEHGPCSISGRSNQSIMGIRSDFNVIESYGFQLPVLVNEALNFDEGTQGVSVMCSQNGWAWIVHGRRLLIWQYKDTRSSCDSPSLHKESRKAQRRDAMAQCRELTLPHCDIGHKASLVCVFISDGQQMASCLAVSPTGDARYWTSIAHDGSSIDATGILEGQEFDQLLSLPRQQGYILVTTTCSLIFLQLQLINGRHVIHHKPIRPPSSFFGGIGEKMASILIGAQSGNEKENKFISIACEKSGEFEAAVTILADRWIQRWRVANNGQTLQLLYEDSEIIRTLRDEFQQKFWSTRNPADGIEINLHVLDMHISDGKTYVLGGGVNIAHTPQMYYGIAVLTAAPNSMRFVSFIPLKLTQFYSINTERECLGLRFIISRSLLYLYTDKVVYPLNLSKPALGEIETAKIEFNLQEDRILSASVCGNIPLFFSRIHGLISVTPSDFDSSDLLNVPVLDIYSSVSDSFVREQTLLSDSAMNQNSLCMFELDPDAIYNEFKDEVSQLKAAFIYRLKQNHAMCNNILKGLQCLTTEAQHSALNYVNELDKVVVKIAEDLAEDIPAADPRWEHFWEDSIGSKCALGSSSSLQIVTQLKEKNVALRHFVEFLHATDLWHKLSAVRTAGSNVPKPTCYAIADINEKIIAAIALKILQSKYSKIIDDAIIRATSKWKKVPMGNITAQDLFYVRISKFQDIFQALSDVADSRIGSQHQSSAVATTIADINTIVLKLVNETIEFRVQNAGIYSPPADKLDAVEYLPWTAMSGNAGIRDALSHLVGISLYNGARCAVEPELKQILYQQILELVDFILDGRKNHLDSVRDSEKYNVLLQQFECQRRDLIYILVKDGQYELATKLAEKYLDFQSLIIICDETNNQDRLESYLTKYEEYDFAQFGINWYLRQKRAGEIFERFKGHKEALSQFVHDHPSLGWVQLVFNRDMERAAKTLFELATKETEFVSRKKIILSLAKLAAWSADSDMTELIESIRAELKIVEHQERLNDNVLQAFGYDTKDPKVLKVEEIINLLISEENETANERDFHKALELLGYVEDPYELRHKIWCTAILRDNWIDYDSDNAVDYLQNLLFFKLIELCHLMGGDLENFLPPIDDFLNSGELGDMVQNKSYQFLLKLTYEYTAETFKSSEPAQAMKI